MSTNSDMQTEFKPEAGKECIWMYTQRGGWGFQRPVRVTVLKVTSKRARIQVPLAAGGTVERSVAHGSLRAL